MSDQGKARITVLRKAARELRPYAFETKTRPEQVEYRKKMTVLAAEVDRAIESIKLLRAENRVMQARLRELEAAVLLRRIEAFQRSMDRTAKGEEME